MKGAISLWRTATFPVRCNQAVLLNPDQEIVPDLADFAKACRASRNFFVAALSADVPGRGFRAWRSAPARLQESLWTGEERSTPTESLQPAISIADICDGSESVTAAMDGLTEAGVALIESAAEIGLAGNVPALYRSDPPEAEGALRDMVFDMTRTILRDAFELLDDHGASLELDGRNCRKAGVTAGRAMTMFGPVAFLRSRCRPSGHGAAPVPAESVPGLTACGLTPAAAGLSMYLTSGLTARESEDAFRNGPHVKHGVLRMNAGTADGKATDAGWREASCGVVALVDAEGDMLESRCFGRLPEAGKAKLKSQLKAKALHWLDLDPDLKIAVVADGAPDGFRFLETLCPDVVLLDFCATIPRVPAR